MIIWAQIGLLFISVCIFTGTNTPLEYFSVAIKKAGTPVTIDRLAMMKACIPGMPIL